MWKEKMEFIIYRGKIETGSLFEEGLILYGLEKKV